ncbi:hypothetical protein HFO61_30190 [Rhizobium leguminosarum]|uniref:hypothetical protein n=1 Tax=Rhizobium leguminosarum TaxID=384 RepID=UPI001C97D1E9|nr:hypothetical protein [Rhizobium leguminosarum]MBY5551017.1 hypothetical protein [Rhizobium leguminosarum]
MTPTIKKLLIDEGRIAVPFPSVISVCLITLESNDFSREYLTVKQGTVPVAGVNYNDVIEFVGTSKRYGCRVSKINSYVLCLEVHETTFQAVRAANPLPAKELISHAGKFPIWRDVDFESPPLWYEFRALLPDWHGPRGDE